MSVAIIWAKKVQLTKCDILVGFRKSSHNLYDNSAKINMHILTVVAMLCSTKQFCIYKAVGYQTTNSYIAT